MNKKGIGIIAAIIIVVVAFVTWNSLPTKIAFVNFQDSQLASFMKANENSFIKINKVNLKGGDLSELEDYNIIYFFHVRGLNEVQNANLTKAKERGAKIYFHMSIGAKENNTIEGEELEYVRNCMKHGGLKNYAKILNYSRVKLDGQSLFTDEITAPIEYPSDVFYRIGTKDYYTSAADYWEDYKAKGLYKEGKQKVVMVNASASFQTEYRSYQDKMIEELESKGYNVACIGGWGKRMEYLKEADPDMVIYFPHGRLVPRKGDETVAWLKEKNIPLLTPQLVYQPYEVWMADQQGMSGALMGQNIVVPELDGATTPYAVAAKFKNEKGLYTYKEIPGRVEQFCDMADRWLRLKTTPESDKKICIYYYKGAGKNAMVAEGLEIGNSLLSLLDHLRANGIHTGDRHPKTAEELLEIIQREGPLLGDYAQGSFQEFLKEGNPALISEQEYIQWCKDELDPTSFTELKNSYGPAPGKYMTTRKGDTNYLAIPRVLFGNVALLPVMPAAMEENEFKFVHGVKKAPPHAYVASYLWARKGFDADVVSHFGTHGSVEFTPWKQVSLCRQDWAEALIAPTPHLYIYSVNNIGEAMMAKRRTYATMLTHVTPPYSDAGWYDEFEDLHVAMHNFRENKNEKLKGKYKERILAFVDSLGLQKDLDLEDQVLAEMSEETMELLDDYTHHLRNEKITIGLHTLGKKFTEDEKMETVRMMSVDPLTSLLVQLAVLKGEEDPAIMDSEGELSHNYRLKAEHIISEILKKGADPMSFFAKGDLEKMDKLLAAGHTHSHGGHTHTHTHGEEKHSHGKDGHSHSHAASHSDKKGGHSHSHAASHSDKKGGHSHSHAASHSDKKGGHAHSHAASHSDKKGGYTHSYGQTKKEEKSLTPEELKEKELMTVLKQYKEALTSIPVYMQQLAESPDLELNSYINGLNGGYIEPSSGGDPAFNRESIPTGKNIYSINAEKTPTKEAWEVGKELGDQVLQAHIAKHGEYPKKIAYSLWSSEFIRNEGLNIAQIFYLMGVEPVRNSRGSVHDVKLIPMERLKRPRVDVVVQTSGQFRDIAASRITLINKAIQVATNANDEGEYANYVKEGTFNAEKMMKEKGISPADARKFSTIRVFGGVNGSYGTGIMGMVEKGDSWETDKEIADQYLMNMGAMYDDGNWADYQPGVFEAQLQNTEAVVHPRSSNVTGPISLDHVYEFMGGISATIRNVTGKDPDGYFNDYRNKYNPTVQGLREAIWAETRTHLFNPKFIEGQMQEGPSAAEGFAENFRDTYGWNVMKPSAIDREIWDGYYEIYVQDRHKLGVKEFFDQKNPYALQEMTAVMLETVRKGYWNPDEQVVKDIANLHAELIKKHEAGCSGFVCDNGKLSDMIAEVINDEYKAEYEMALEKVQKGTGEQSDDSVVLKEEEIAEKDLNALVQNNKDAIVTLVAAIALLGGTVLFGITRRRRKAKTS